ncbi:MAG: translation initiation factor IF-3 [Candidatus Yanofskybacteria bacterium RIFCSPLOWO2_01_FULL_41_34]|uniref:Translation initiation factor IF-3 n=1 Tax=Candidatus Yanofskybacteria bacterium RIFCSPHIGHO2_01_FULL_41_26 TaxID=1802661 RepID=A0A1F8ECF0_9BACT|nr:MAG: translation initiation factor IF-3 [Candidatus Yanofskybacteria bacterium RIFCSPHIGHO2_01_FULL_41_26]OGN21597.1 MAG: translation initiation factor IF-3 [Candidatus Yanofskybacteria bacterium RIFCSPLOWO2_01_FULL_41_34]
MLKRLRINNQIKAIEVQVIDENGKQLGTMKTFDALKLAREKDLDLAEVGPNVQPPIAKIMDYGKYIYRKKRQEKKSGPKQKEQERKTVRVGFKTGTHDLEFKAKQIKEFLNEGHIVKIELTLRGREKALAHLGKEKLNNFIKLIGEEFAVQEAVKRSPFGWTTTIKK